MRIIFFLLISIFLYANDNNITSNEDNLTLKIDKIKEELKKNEFYLDYESYLTYQKLQNRVYTLEKLAKRYPKKYKEKLQTLKTELALLDENKNLLNLIKIKELPPPPPVNNPFQIFSALNYEKEVKKILEENNKNYEKFKKTLDLLYSLQDLEKKLNIKNRNIKKIVEDFNTIDTIYKTKLKTLHSRAKINIERVKKEIQTQINKLISLIITIGISILIFMLIKSITKNI